MGIILAVISLVVTYTLGRRGISRKFLLYRSQSRCVIGDTSLGTDVSVYLGTEPVSSLYRTNIVIWSAGNQTIEGADIVVDDPLRLECVDGVPNAVIDECEGSSKRVCPTLEREGEDLFIKFGTLEQDDEIRISLLYDGEGRSIRGSRWDDLFALRDTEGDGYISITGSIRGIRRIGYIERGFVRATLSRSGSVIWRINTVLIFITMALGVPVMLGTFILYPLASTYVLVRDGISKGFDREMFDHLPEWAPFGLLLGGGLIFTWALISLIDWVDKDRTPPSEHKL